MCICGKDLLIVNFFGLEFWGLLISGWIGDFFEDESFWGLLLFGLVINKKFWKNIVFSYKVDVLL